MEFSGAMIGSWSDQVSLKEQPTISVHPLRSKPGAEPTTTVTLGIFGSPAHLHIMDTVHYIEAQVQPKKKDTDAYKKHIMSI